MQIKWEAVSGVTTLPNRNFKVQFSHSVRLHCSCIHTKRTSAASTNRHEEIIKLIKSKLYYTHWFYWSCLRLQCFLTMHPRVLVCLLVPTIMENILILVSLFQASLWTWLVSGVIVENTLNIAQSDQAPKIIGWWFGASPPVWGPMSSSYPNQRNHKKIDSAPHFCTPGATGSTDAKTIASWVGVPQAGFRGRGMGRWQIVMSCLYRQKMSVNVKHQFFWDSCSLVSCLL